MPRFFLPFELHCGEIVELPDSVLRHVQVLRLRDGDALHLFDGRGGEFSARLIELGRRVAKVEVGVRLEIERESPLRIMLAQGVSTGDRMDYTLQKGVEMGVTVFQPLATERAVLKLGGERAERKTERWRDIVIAACEQCGRNTVPEVRPLMGLVEFLASPAEADLRLVLSPQGGRRFADYPVRPESVWLLAGPEGGLSAAEEALAFAAGWSALQLGPRILRTETAVLAAAGAMQTRWGDYA